ncbi:MAG: glucose-6-phosphate isomerase [Legionella sp.]|nr:MAG: glucose-6-phosphate isomerase [Legionella sp.]
MMLLTQRASWKKLEEHAQTLHYKAVWQTEMPLILHTDAITLDFSHQKIDDTALKLLGVLAEDCQIKPLISQLMTGYPLNRTSPALHTALRHFGDEPLWVNDVNVKQDIIAVRARMGAIADQIRSGQWLGHTGKPVTDIINIGIGGSMLGPQFCIDALADKMIKTLKFHFISEFDTAAFQRVVADLNPETTLFIVSSKSFTTAETLLNASRALEWGQYASYASPHFIAVTADIEKAQSMAFQHILPVWSWVGGRYSVCSAINLITCIAIGFEHFIELLQGASQMDEHFHEADVLQNMPIMLALLGIWNNNNLKIHNLLILTYAQSLQWFVPYLQQLEMESNGKSIDRQGRDLNYATVPIIWGGSGNQAQHSYFQLLSQGTHRLSADLISVRSQDTDIIDQHKEALLCEIKEEDNPNRHIPCNHLQLVDNSPRTIGALIALYEHKVFVQSVIWNINPFDQPGVERMKQKMAQFLPNKASIIVS